MDRNRVGGKFQIHTNHLRKKQMANESGNNAVQGFQWLNRMVSEPYYLFHFLTFFSYFIIRSSASEVLAPHLIQHLLRREIQTLLVFAILVVIKGVKEDNWEAFIADALFLGKICLFVLAFTMDRHLAVWYIIVFLVIHMLTQQPLFHGLGTSSKLTPLQLESLLTEGTTTRLWLVEFRASYSPACIRSSQHFPELSITYSSKNLSFGIVDLGLFPNAAEKFGISLSGSMGQLPTYILFENAAEVARFPELDFEATYFHPTITKGLLSRHFELDRHLLEYFNGK
ncbi:thioredoxin-related transmembrane protein 2 [Vigna radiata var. radiata]|uniref:Thioredoxin-related transmembrane protein 2 n=1 Tax=Vigna radiata var. radiata TaxID=3916 RepID=A0A1S3U9Z1_VIGRR|nr:thioredoxin-related transmembrane protein 2 [Vigna radiata var. radiata]